MIVGVIVAAIYLVFGCYLSTAAANLRTEPPSSHKVTPHDKNIASNNYRYQNWKSNFKAANPAVQDACHFMINNETSKFSQFGQDLFLFFNLFKFWPSRERKGFYVDSGANDAVALSNSFFFDQCLGWAGLCVEPNPKYHEGHLSKRSCKLVPECIADSDKELTFVNSGEYGHVDQNGNDSLVTSPHANAANEKKTTQCRQLSSMLTKYGNQSHNYAQKLHIDLWSLDVEGFEMTVLKSINFSHVDISVIIIEDFWLSSVTLDKFMTANGFVKYYHLAIDSVYVNRNFMNHAAVKPWLTRDHDEAMSSMTQYRKNVGPSRLTCL